MNKNYFCIFDFETGGANPHICEILQIGSLIVEPKTLTVVDTFKSLVKPLDFNTLEDGALKVNGIAKETLEKLEDAYLPDVVFNKWATWINKYNRSKGTPSPYNAPIPVGYNILSFDMVLLNRYCQKYNFFDSKRNQQKLLNQVSKIDIYDLIWIWFEHCSDDIIENLRLTTVARHLGAEERQLEKAHDAMVDCYFCADILISYLKRTRSKLPQMNYMKDMLKNA